MRELLIMTDDVVDELVLSFQEVDVARPRRSIPVPTGYVLPTVHPRLTRDTTLDFHFLQSLTYVG